MKTPVSILAAAVAALLFAPYSRAERPGSVQDVFLDGASPADSLTYEEGHVLTNEVDLAQLFSAGDLEGTIAVADSLLQRDSLCDAAWFYKGRCLMLQEKQNEGIVCLQRAIALDPDNPWYYDPLFSQYYYNSFYKGIDARALEDLCLELDSRFPGRYDDIPEFTLVMAEACRVKGNTPAFFNHVLKLAGNPEVSPAFKADYVENVLNRVDGPTFRVWKPQLDSLVEGCLECHPGDSSLLKVAGVWYYRTERKDLSARMFDEWAEAWPSSTSPHEVKLELAFIEGRMADVVHEAETIIAMDPSKKAQMYGIIGDVYYEIGYPKRTFSYYNKALRAQADYITVLNNYAYYLSLEEKRLRKAEKMARSAVEQQPDNPTFLDTLGWILHLRGKNEEAKGIFKHAITYGGKENLAILEHYAEVLESLGETSLANYYKTLAKSRKQ